MEISAIATASAIFIKNQVVLTLAFLGLGSASLAIQIAAIAALIIVPVAVVTGIVLLARRFCKEEGPDNGFANAPFEDSGAYTPYIPNIPPVYYPESPSAAATPEPVDNRSYAERLQDHINRLGVIKKP